MQCADSSGRFPRGKRTATVRRYPASSLCLSFFCVHCFRVFIPPAVMPTLLRQMDMGSLTCAQIWVRAVHAKAQASQLTRRDRKTVPHPAPLEGRTQGLNCPHHAPLEGRTQGLNCPPLEGRTQGLNCPPPCPTRGSNPGFKLPPTLPH